ncbi:hypothetical protein M3936_01105 [Sutcliffiella horikoshii]|uniref:hypothetical protein n=1 Tax=Sutcliffiella horikoshii TaxID=79883 RepID=UPI00203BC96B|nr:hypothetical protein [Sutcliffiella horikoshii]MCM3616166.1 hypothetical protein [Sutcliffiella horikoshii]
MPGEIADDLTNMMSAMAFTVFQTVFTYIALPVILVILVGGFVLKLRWRFLQLFIIPTAFIGLYFFATSGLPNMHEAYLLKINQ